MTPIEIIQNLLAGGLLGLIGQGIRMAIGLKKLSDVNAGKDAATAEKPDGTRLLISLFIGFIAGALFLLTKGDNPVFTTEFIFSAMAAGYSGADFIEGLFSNTLGKMNAQATVATTTTVTTAPASPVVTTTTTTPASTAAAPITAAPVDNTITNNITLPTQTDSSEPDATNTNS